MNKQSVDQEKVTITRRSQVVTVLKRELEEHLQKSARTSFSLEGYSSSQKQWSKVVDFTSKIYGGG